MSIVGVATPASYTVTPGTTVTGTVTLSDAVGGLLLAGETLELNGYVYDADGHTLAEFDEVRAGAVVTLTLPGTRTAALGPSTSSWALFVSRFSADPTRQNYGIKVASGVATIAGGASAVPGSNTPLSVTDSNTIDLVATGTDNHSLTANLRIDSTTPGNVTFTSGVNGLKASVTIPSDLHVTGIAASVTPGHYTATLSDASTFDVDLTALDEAPATAVPLTDQVTGLVGTSAKYAREDHVHPSTAIEPFVTTKAYAAGEVVSIGNKLAVANTALAAGAFVWGSTGAAWSPSLPPTLTFKGVYSAATTYTPGDVVASAAGSNAGLYMAQAVTTGNATTSAYFQPLTAETINAFLGATSTVAGQRGFVPAPAAGQQASFLRGDATWATVPAGIKQWVTATAYAVGDYIEDPVSHLLYRATVAYTSGATVAADVLAGNLVEVSPSGASTSTPLSYMHAALSAVGQSTNIAIGDHAKFDTAIKSISTGVTLDTSTAYSSTAGAASIGRFTLAAGKTFKLTAALSANLSSGGNVQYQWYNATTGTALGTRGGHVDPTGQENTHPTAVAVITTTVSTLVEVQIVAAANLLSLSSRIAGLEQYATIEELPVSTVVDPGTITPTPLASAELRYAAAGGPNGGSAFSGTGIQQATWFTPGTGAQVFQANLVATATLTSDFVVTSASVLTCNKTGTYTIRAEIGWDSVPSSIEPYLQIIVGGVVVGVRTVSTGGASLDAPEISWTGTITAGQGISICHGGSSAVSGGAISSYHLSVREQPNSTVVDPGTITPTPLHRASYATSAGGNNLSSSLATTIGSGYFTLNLQDALFNAIHDPANLRGTNRYLTIQHAGDYAISASYSLANPFTINQIFGVYVNGTRIAARRTNTTVPGPLMSVEVIRTFAVGDRIEFGTIENTNFNDTAITIEELPTSTVIDPGAITVNDQSTTGYIDIGGMRQAWGKTLSTLDGDETITFGVTFASPPVVTATTDVGSGTGAAYGGAIKTITTTNFLYNRDDTIQNPDNAFINWFAIGRKP